MVTVVTGAGSGIGAATSRVLSDRGDKVVCADLDINSAERTSKALADAIAVEVDVSSEASCDSLIEKAVAQYGRVDAIVTCAGIEVHGASTDYPLDTFERIIRVNLVGTFLCARAAARKMIAQGDGGSVVMIGSTNSIRGSARAAAYCASKGGVLLLGRSLAIEWAAHDIRVNVIGPGVVDTPMSDRSLNDPERRASLLGQLPMRRPADPREIGQVAAFLTSSGASFMTGAYVPVDGGTLAG